MEEMRDNPCREEGGEMREVKFSGLRPETQKPDFLINRDCTNLNNI
jgi:hypothetical protein